MQEINFQITEAFIIHFSRDLLDCTEVAFVNLLHHQNSGSDGHFDFNNPFWQFPTLLSVLTVFITESVKKVGPYCDQFGVLFYFLCPVKWVFPVGKNAD